MVAYGRVTLRRLGEGRAGTVRFGRFLNNRKVTTERLIEGWGASTKTAVAKRHVLAIQDTTELNFRTTKKRRRGLGEIGKGVGRGLLVHTMLGLDAATGAVLGLLGGRIWTRRGRITKRHGSRALSAKESGRWADTAKLAKPVLASADIVTFMSDREGDVFAMWSMRSDDNIHVLGRVYCDRKLASGGTLYSAAKQFPFTGSRIIEVRERADRPERQATVQVRFGEVTILRPKSTPQAGLPPQITLTFIEAVEEHPPEGVEPLHWRLLTSHEVPDAATAWRIVGWYKQRWTIEQLHRIMKLQGFRVEDSQLETAERLLKLAAIVPRAAVIALQLQQARDGKAGQAADIAFTDAELLVLDALNPQLEGKTVLQKNPHTPRSLAWAAWIIARLGGWDGYPKSRPPGPITFKVGLDHFKTFAAGWALRHVCMP